MTSLAERSEAEAAPVGRILVIDDEQRILNFVHRGLEAEGMSVDSAREAEEGLRLALANMYDLVVLDLVMRRWTVRPCSDGSSSANPHSRS
jgi:CheY-like chemotaxis protein